METGEVLSGAIEKLKSGPKGSKIACLVFEHAGRTVQSDSGPYGLRWQNKLLADLHESKKTVGILYNPDRPKRVMILDLLVKPEKPVSS